MGKLFGRDHKAASREPPASPDPDNLTDFFRGSTDRLDVSHPAPPPGPPLLAKLDISKATRYPNALSVHNSQQSLPLRVVSQSRQIRRNKGLVVRFVDTFPDIIGEGGDECEVPTKEIGRRRPARPPAVTSIAGPPRAVDILEQPQRAFTGDMGQDDFVPTPLRRTQTGYSTISDVQGPEIPAGEPVRARYLDSHVVSNDEKRRSFIEVHQAEMREAEGLAFATFHRNSVSSSPMPSRDIKQTPPPKCSLQNQLPGTEHFDPTEEPVSPLEDEPTVLPVRPAQHEFTPYKPSHSAQSSQPTSAIEASPTQMHSHPPGTPDNRVLQGAVFEQSPSSIYSQASSFAYRQPSLRQGSKLSDPNEHVSHDQRASHPSGESVTTAADELLDIFVSRTRHLFALFRLHAEMTKPLTTFSQVDLIRAAVWWFLRGRMALEAAVRDRPTTPQGQQANEFARQQAYADIAKGYWVAVDVIPDIMESKRLVPDPEVAEVRAGLKTALQKLCLSMQRNDFLPPEEAFLPQTIDKSIWVEYTPVSRDIMFLLWGSSISALALPRRTDSGISLHETLPVADSRPFFCFGRVAVDVFLMEQGAHESERLYFPCLLSIIRPQQKPNLTFVIASQNGAVQLRIQGNKNAGPVWDDDVRWRSEACCIDVRMPRGFILVIQCTQPDFRMLWNMYDFSAKVQSSLYPRQDEQPLFRSTLKAFQYFDNDPQSRQFPKESTPGCEMGLYERVQRERGAKAPRLLHRGYRIAVVTGTQTKTLSGVNQVYVPQQPVRYDFLRGEHNDPALSLKFENGKQKGSMVMTFNDEGERLQVHSLLIGTALHPDEGVYCELPIRGVWFAKQFGDVGSFTHLTSLPWERVSVINDDGGGDRPSCVLSDKLRIIFECKEATVTDRVNVAPGELRLRLDVANPSCLMVYRQPQADLTLALTEAKVPKERSQAVTADLEALQQMPTLRTYMFPTVADMHRFQEALTGYKVVFDGIASAFAISRRRMVVPIHKKWEAGATRVQVVQQGAASQLLAFFEDFAHGKCVSFALKGTDVFEAFGKSGRAGVKFDDAKFPLPRVPANPDQDDVRTVAETAFVCLDLPELPGEHDDISITFESEVGKTVIHISW